jgi:hypothetical protein
MTRGTNIDFSRTNLSIENAICEIIDNSRDSCFKNNTKKIHIVFEQGVKNTQVELMYPTDKAPNKKDYSKSFSIAIYDNGLGFSNEGELHDAFQIIQDPKLAKKRAKEDTGKFHLGMKEAALNRFHHFSLITKIGSGLMHRSIRYPGDENSCLYDWDSSKVNNNPSLILPSHLNQKTVEAYMKKNKMKTCGIMSAARKPMTNNKADEYSKLDDFIAHMGHFIGIAYHKDLVNASLEIKIGIPSIMKNVEPVDLFWSEATPTAIKNYPSLNPKATGKAKYICEEMYGFGVLSGVRQKAQVRINSIPHHFYVTPYLVPSDEARKELIKVTTKWNKSKVADVEVPDVSSTGKLFSAQNLQGYTFVRSGRTIIIGNMKNAENYGFYNGIRMIESTTKARVRIKVEYEGNRLLDSEFRILPNKDGYEYITQEVWDAINVILMNNIDGTAAKNFSPHNKIGPFYEKGKPKERHFNDRIGLTKKKDWCKVCKKVYHEKGKKCPERLCTVCDTPMNKNPCTIKKCGHKCTICGKTGHKAKCPTLKCKICSKLLPCLCCPVCKKLTCICPPPTCPTCSKSPCVCPPPPFLPSNFGPDGMGFGDSYSVDYYPSQKSTMITLIKKMMKDSKIKKSDL